MRSVNDARQEQESSARDRILKEAISRFGAHGFSGVGVRAIAAGAGVSPALVLHHFGSKEDLGRACDEYVAGVVRKNKQQAMTEGPPPDPFQLLRAAGDSQPLLRYVARMLVDGSPGSAALVDAMVSDAVEYMAQGVESGMLNPSRWPYERAVVLTIWQLGAMALSPHVERLLNVDLLNDPAALMRWGRPALEIFTHALFADDRWERAVAQMFDDAVGGENNSGTGGEE